MCLKNVLTEKQIASDNIVVYKVAYTRTITGDRLYAPFQPYIYSLNEIMNSRLIKYKTDVFDGFHSFAFYEDAKNVADGFNNNIMNIFDRTYHVMKAYIPKGSEYFIGNFNGAVSYASNQLMIVRHMEDWDIIKYRWKTNPIIATITNLFKRNKE